MKPSLYFLRSSEAVVLQTVAHYAFRMDETDQAVPDKPGLKPHLERYGMTDKDFGIYATGSEHKIIGAAWLRLHAPDSLVNGFVDEHTPILNMAVLPEHRKQRIGGILLSQLMQEASNMYVQVSVSVVKDHPGIGFFKYFGFVEVEGKNGISPVDGKETVTLVCDISGLQPQRPPEEQDTSRWVD